tara:strand:+ start:1377 stop:1559 length:183 start_codon:yes stop_codon:yes gene_type:complete
MIEEKAKRIILNILNTKLSMMRESLKKCQSDKNCNLETYENIVEECQQIEYAIYEMENMK